MLHQFLLLMLIYILLSGEMAVLKPVRPTSQTTATHLATSISDKPLPSTSSAGAAFQYTDYDFDQQSDPISPVQPLEEEVSDKETGTVEQEPDQVTSEEQNYWEL